MTKPRLTRRSFLQAASFTAAATLLQPDRLSARSSAPRTRSGSGDAEPTPYPYVDGLCTLSGDVADVGRSGLSAFMMDVSAGAPIETADGTIRFYRSFDASVQSLLGFRRYLNAGGIPGAFLATRGSEIPDAWRQGRTAIFLQFQGAQPLEGDLWRLDLFHELGLRVLQLTHHNANPFAGGALDPEPTGLTPLGHELVERMNELGIIPDVSHGSDATSLDVARASKGPVILSHGAARALVRNARCATDEVIRAIADTGGVVGIFMMSFWLTEDPVPTVDHYVRQIRHVVNVGGIEAVGVANDYPVSGEANLRRLDNDNAEGVKGYWPWWESIAREGIPGFDAGNLPKHVVIPELNNVRRMFLIDDALEKAGFAAAERERIMGGNWIRVLTEALGQAAPIPARSS